MTKDDFYEDDESVDKIRAIFDSGDKGVTARPAPRGLNLSIETVSSQTGTYWSRTRTVAAPVVTTH